MNYNTSQFVKTTGMHFVKLKMLVVKIVKLRPRTYIPSYFACNDLFDKQTLELLAARTGLLVIDNERNKIP